MELGFWVISDADESCFLFITGNLHAWNSRSMLSIEFLDISEGCFINEGTSILFFSYPLICRLLRIPYTRNETSSGLSFIRLFMLEPMLFIYFLDEKLLLSVRKNMELSDFFEEVNLMKSASSLFVRKSTLVNFLMFISCKQSAKMSLF